MLDKLSLKGNTIFLMFVALPALFLLGCEERTPALQKIQGPAQGTTYHLSWRSAGPVDAAKLKVEIDATFAEIDKQISNYRDDSDIELFNRNPSTEWQEMPAAVIDLLQIAASVYLGSGGCYDPTVKPLYDLWGFRKDSFHIPAAEEIAKVRAYVGFDKIILDVPAHRVRKVQPQVSIDMSSMGEGYTVLRLSSVFEGAGITDYLLEIGGDMYMKGGPTGEKQWRVGIARPLPEEMAIEKVVEIKDRSGVSLNTSGTYRHHYDVEGKRYSHIFDPRSGAPVTHDLVSATAIGDDPRLTDAWATAMLCLGKTAGDEVAKKEGLAIFFIQQQEGKLVESASPALQNSTSVTFR